jgi:MAP3K TRAFs-binding domain
MTHFPFPISHSQTVDCHSETPMIIAHAGRRTDAADAVPPRFPAGNTDWVAQNIRGMLERQRAAGVVSSAACGADLLVLREAGALGLRRRVVLPFDAARFRQTSVVDRPGDWGTLYDKVIAEVTAAGELIVLPGPSEGDAAYAAVNGRILDEAAALGRGSSGAAALLVWDGQSRGEGDLTEAFGKTAESRGMRVLNVRTVRTCFVVQGFGEKTDLSTGRVLNLDASYEVIKEAVEAAGVRCIRADEIIHSGAIDVPMYEWIYRADLVIADLSTYNLNAAYELGVRYGVRPGATMIVAENQFKNPFDVSHIVTLPYEHLGKDIGRREATRFKKELADRIKQIVAAGAVDSPVYTFMQLKPPSEEETPSPAVEATPATGTAPPTPAEDPSAKTLLTKAKEAMAASNFMQAKTLFQLVRDVLPRDEYVVQQLALATYKSKYPDPASALVEAREYLQLLTPDTTNDPETLGLWGAIHKRFWDLKHEPSDLNESIAAYERGFYVKQDYYNGINYAFLLNVRASQHKESGNAAEAIADFVLAQRVRRDVIKYCEAALKRPSLTDETKYWIVATMWEAAVGLDDAAAADKYKADAEATRPAGWMLSTTNTQLDTLRKLLAASPLKP